MATVAAPRLWSQPTAGLTAQIVKALEMSYMVLCREDRKLDGTPGRFVVATQKQFSLLEEAQHYVATISSSREPKVVKITSEKELKS